MTLIRRAGRTQYYTYVDTKLSDNIQKVDFDMQIHRGLPLRLPARKDLCTTDVITTDALNYFAKVFIAIFLSLRRIKQRN